jgi:hypothetical protein
MMTKPAVGSWVCADTGEVRREECLRKQGFEDAFRQVKDEENDKALLLLPDVLA